tara:strand:- start:435 stop:587 length:153 start_codon:yes stop_codon:yes gene_type:complete
MGKQSKTLGDKPESTLFDGGIDVLISVKKEIFAHLETTTLGRVGAGKTAQ